MLEFVQPYNSKRQTPDPWKIQFIYEATIVAALYYPLRTLVLFYRQNHHIRYLPDARYEVNHRSKWFLC